MREAWRELMFADEDQVAKRSRDPVAPAKRSAAALNKIATQTLADHTKAHSFATLLAELSMIVRNTCRSRNATPATPTIQLTTLANAKQRRAFELLDKIRL